MSMLMTKERQVSAGYGTGRAGDLLIVHCCTGASAAGAAYESEVESESAEEELGKSLCPRNDTVVLTFPRAA